MTPNEIFDEVEAGKYLGGESTPISPRTMQRMRQTGEGPRFHKYGAAVRYRRPDLDEYREACRVGSTSEYTSARRHSRTREHVAA